MTNKTLKRYRILYWFNSITTDYYTHANSKKEAREKFLNVKGAQREKDIIRIECVDLLRLDENL